MAKFIKAALFALVAFLALMASSASAGESSGISQSSL